MPPPPPVVDVEVRELTVPMATVSPAVMPLLISAAELVTRPTCTSTRAVCPSEPMTRTVYEPDDPLSAEAGTVTTLSNSAVVTATLADIPARTAAGGLVRVTLTAYVTTLEPPVVAATGEIWVTAPATVAPAAVTVTVAGWPTFSFTMSVSVKLPVTIIGPAWSWMAYPDGAMVPATTFTAVTTPSSGATSWAPARAVFALVRLAWALATAAVSLWIWMTVAGTIFVA